MLGRVVYFMSVMMILSSCSRYIDVTASYYRNHVPVFIFSDRTCLEEFSVYAPGPDKRYLWGIVAEDGCVIIEKLEYGYVPDGFRVTVELNSLRDGVVYAAMAYARNGRGYLEFSFSGHEILQGDLYK